MNYHELLLFFYFLFLFFSNDFLLAPGGVGIRAIVTKNAEGKID